jgi:hypothetical protein
MKLLTWQQKIARMHRRSFSGTTAEVPAISSIESDLNVSTVKSVGTSCGKALHDGTLKHRIMLVDIDHS